MDLNNLIPENFREIFSFFAFSISLIFAFLSLIRNKMDHCLKLSAILFIISVSLFANNPYCYFAAIFIIATAVTQLDFLQNLAAIIRGSKEYFDYQKETKSTKDVEKDLEKESNTIDNATVEEDIKSLETQNDNINVLLNKQNLSLGQFAFVCEEYAFKLLEQKFQRPIQRYVRIKSRRYATEFDGIMQYDYVDVILEIKTTRRGVFSTMFIKNTIEKLLQKIEDYKEITKRGAALRLVLIGNFTNAYKARLLSKLPDLAQNDKGVEVAIDFYSFSELGMDINDIEINKI
jgi:hypothetical protein